MATLINVIEVLKSVNFIINSIDRELHGLSIGNREVKILVEKVVTFEPIPWQLRGLLGKNFKYEKAGEPLNPFATNGDFVPYLAYLKAWHKVELGLNFSFGKFNSITLNFVRTKDNTILFNHTILRDRLKTVAHSDLLSLIKEFNLNRGNKRIISKMLEVKACVLLSMTFVENFLDFPTYGCKVIADGLALRDTVEAIYRINGFLNKIGNSTLKVLSNAWTLGELL